MSDMDKHHLLYDLGWENHTSRIEAQCQECPWTGTHYGHASGDATRRLVRAHERETGIPAEYGGVMS